MNSSGKTTTRRAAVVLATLIVLPLVGCGSATPDSTANVASPVVDASGVSTPATLPDGSSPTIVPGDTAPGGTAPGGTAPGGTVPTPSPAPTTPPPPPTTAPPTTVPAPKSPIAINLMRQGGWDLYADQADGAGGSGQIRQDSSSSVGLRSYAWHGYNGVNTTRAAFRVRYDAAPVLADLGTDLALVSVRFRAFGNGTVKAPWDRAARAEVNSDAGAPGSLSVTRRLLHVERLLPYEQDAPSPFSFDETVELPFYVNSDDPQIHFNFFADCAAWGGGQAFALLNEGFCDMYEAGGVTLEYVDATFSSIEWLRANDIDHPAPPQ